MDNETLRNGDMSEALINVPNANGGFLTGGSMETMIQPKITGYRQLSEAEVALMNEGKELAERCGAYIEKLRGHADVARKADATKIMPALDQRWISIGATDLQRGFMAVIRGIAQPTTF